MAIDPHVAETLDVIERSGLAAADKANLTRLLVLLATPAAGMTPAQLAEARVAAGLSVGQAARLLGVEKPGLIEIEAGSARATDSLLDRMDEVYGLGPPPLGGRGTPPG